MSREKRPFGRTLDVIALIAAVHTLIGGALVILFAVLLIFRGESAPGELIEKYALPFVESLHPGLLENIFSELRNTHTIFLLLLSGAYALEHGFEAWGLYANKRWGEWYCALDSAVYIPFELESMFHGFTILNTGAFLLNAGILSFMIFAIRKRHAGKTA